MHKYVKSMRFVFKFLIALLATRLAVTYKAGPVDPEVKQLSTFAIGERLKPWFLTTTQ